MMATAHVRSRWTGVVAVMLAGALVGGCAATTPTPPEGAPAVSPFPPRPAAVDVAAIAPCTMLSSAQQARLGLRRPAPGQGRVDGRPSPGCGWLGKSDVDYNVQTIPTGAEVAATDPTATVIQVNGFGAVRNAPNDPLTAGRPFCQVSVDVASGQSIRVQALGELSRPRSTEEMCRLATEATSMVMTTVVAAARG